VGCVVHGNRRNGRGHGALCAIQHLGVVGEPGGSGWGEGMRGAVNNCAPRRSLHSRDYKFTRRWSVGALRGPRLVNPSLASKTGVRTFPFLCSNGPFTG